MYQSNPFFTKKNILLILFSYFNQFSRKLRKGNRELYILRYPVYFHELYFRPSCCPVAWNRDILCINRFRFLRRKTFYSFRSRISINFCENQEKEIGNCISSGTLCISMNFILDPLVVLRHGTGTYYVSIDSVFHEEKHLTRSVLVTSLIFAKIKKKKIGKCIRYISSVVPILATFLPILATEFVIGLLYRTSLFNFSLFQIKLALNYAFFG